MTQSSASASRVVLSAVLVSGIGALERVLAVYSSFPGTCLMSYENLSNRRLKRRIQVGRLSKCSVQGGALGVYGRSQLGYVSLV